MTDPNDLLAEAARCPPCHFSRLPCDPLIDADLIERLAARVRELEGVEREVNDYRGFESQQPSDETLMAMYEATKAGPRRMLRFARALLNFVPSAGAAISAAQQSERTNPSCSGCGGPHPFDTSMPSVVWNAVIRARDLPEYLCLTCIVREFARQRQSFTATLWGDEFSGVPIEVRVDNQPARDAHLVGEENNSFRAALEIAAEDAERLGVQLRAAISAARQEPTNG